jgi:hypothetical protein
VLVPSFHGGIFYQNTIRVLTSFHIVFLTLDLCFKEATSDSTKGTIVMIIHAIVLPTIIKRILFLLVVLFTLFQVTGDNPEEVIVKVVEGNILDDT